MKRRSFLKLFGLSMVPVGLLAPLVQAKNLTATEVIHSSGFISAEAYSQFVLSQLNPMNLPMYSRELPKGKTLKIKTTSS